MCIHAVVTRSRSISTIEPLTEDVSHRGASLNCPTQVMYMLQSTFFLGSPHGVEAVTTTGATLW